MPKLPFILIFDIDHAIIGDIRNCVDEKNILEIIFEQCKSQNITIKCPENKFNIEDELKGGLLRPNLKEFVDFCEKKYKNVELFIYTNSSHGWTNGGLVPNIEKASGLKFNKPYFTREYSSMRMKKRISFAYDEIMNVLEKKYPILSKSEKYKQDVFTNRIVFIDDIENNVADLVSKQIVCPRYEYIPQYDIIQKLQDKYEVDEKYINNNEILQYCFRNNIPYFSEKGNDFQKDELYISLEKSRNVSYARIVNNKKDTFFLDLIKMMNKKTKMNDKSIKNINNSINKLPKQ